MKLTYDQFDAAAYIFEKSNGNSKSDYEEKIIAESGLADLKSTDLEKIIISGLNSGIYKDEQDRISAYWALGKRFNPNLIPFFRRRLKSELESNNPSAIYQLLIALENMEEPVFNDDRNGSTASLETELNLRDAKKYLTKIRD